MKIKNTDKQIECFRYIYGYLFANVFFLLNFSVEASALVRDRDFPSIRDKTREARNERHVRVS